MAFVYSPGQLARRASFYQQLASLTAAGVTLVSALETLHRAPPAPSYRSPIQAVLAHVRGGSTFTESLRAAGDWLPEFDLALIGAGEFSGRLDACFRMLAEYYDERARLARQMIADLLYPAFLLHAAVFLLPFPDLFISGDLNAYLLRTLGVLVPVYLLIGTLVFAGQGRHGLTWRSLVERILGAVPVLGRARRELAVGRLSAALEALLSAGVTVFEAWKIAAEASGSPALQRAVARWRPRLEAGETPAELLAKSREFPELFASQYAAGEVSGTLDDALARLRRYYEEEGRRKLRAVAQWLPRALYLAIVLYIGYRVVMFWSGYFQQIENLGAF